MGQLYAKAGPEAAGNIEELHDVAETCATIDAARRLRAGHGFVHCNQSLKQERYGQCQPQGSLLNNRRLRCNV